METNKFVVSKSENHLSLELLDTIKLALILLHIINVLTYLTIILLQEQKYFKTSKQFNY